MPIVTTLALFAKIIKNIGAEYKANLTLNPTVNNVTINQDLHHRLLFCDIVSHICRYFCFMYLTLIVFLIQFVLRENHV